MNPLKLKAYLAGAGMIGLALYQLSQGQYPEAGASLTAGITLICQRIKTG